MTNTNGLLTLQNIVIEAIEYVGFANYKEREAHAKREIDRNFTLYRESKYSYLKFKNE